MSAQCSHNSCPRVVCCRGFCKRHYQLYKRHGELPRVRRLSSVIVEKENHAEVELTRGKWAYIDLQDVPLVRDFTWHASFSPQHQSSYAVRSSTKDGKKITVAMHKQLTGYTLCDHKDRDSLNNRRSNLRPATVAQNAANRTFSRVRTSAFKGVSKNGFIRGKPWCATIGWKGKTCQLGRFDTEEDAAIVYNVAAQLLHGDFAVLNSLPL